MNTLLELLHEYRSLRAQSDALETEARAQMRALGHLLGGRPWPEEGALLEEARSTRRAAAFPLRFTVPGGFARGEVRRLGGAGVLVGTRSGPPLGARSLVCFDVGGTSFVFPAVVAFRQAGRFGAVGLAFDGEPQRSLSDGMWRARLPLSGRRSTALVA